LQQIEGAEKVLLEHASAANRIAVDGITSAIEAPPNSIQLFEYGDLVARYSCIANDKYSSRK
jgi:hypothetical protein